jgi:hypothetical protein
MTESSPYPKRYTQQSGRQDEPEHCASVAVVAKEPSFLRVEVAQGDSHSQPQMSLL